jgi:integrase
MPVHIRERKRASGKVFLYLDVYEDGKREQESTGLWYTAKSSNKREIKEKARDLARRREEELAKGKTIEKSKTDFIEYFEEKSKTKHSPYSTALYHLKAFNEESNLVKTPFKKLNDTYFLDFTDFLLTRVGQNTAHNILIMIKVILNLAVKEKIISVSPARFVSVKKVDVDRAFLTIDELKNMAAAECPHKEVKRAFLFSCYTGLRRSDVKNLTWGNIKNDQIHFRQKKTRGVEYLPLNEQAKKLLYQNIPENVIPLPDQKIFKLPTSGYFTTAIREWTKNAGINKKITYHSSRHTFATLAITQGVDIYTVSKLLGHKDLKNTQIYAKIIDSKMNDAVNKLPSILVEK